MQQNYQFYGLNATAAEVRAFVEHIIAHNLQVEEQGKAEKTPICIWGTHGIGKTALVEAIAKENNWKFAYIAPAQFEEMGDLLGMPTIEGEQTVFKQPLWVPTDEGPGILLIDDVNRADDRILRGIMQLLQNFELVSWKLPEKWQIVLTANPDGGDYSVTPMDDAMLTRMMHITMHFEPKNWAIWAEKVGIDPRGINFVLTYPEIANGKRTTPRSLVQFFRSLAGIADLKKEISLVQTLASSCLDEETVAAFVSFVQQNLAALITPEEIINATNFTEEVTRKMQELVVGEVLRVDTMATICTRLLAYLAVNNISLTPMQLTNIQSFIKLDFIPNDLRLSLLQDLVSSKNTSLKMVMSDPEIGKMLLNNM